MTDNPVSEVTSSSWLHRSVPGVKQRQVEKPMTAQSEPSVSCFNCNAVTTLTALRFNQNVCPSCDEHLAMSTAERFNWLFDQIDETLFEEIEAVDPLGFVDTKPYTLRLEQAIEKTGATEALSVCRGRIEDLELIACAFDFAFLGGSMGSVVGDRFCKAAERCLSTGLPLVCFATSGGGGMQEGLLSLMQMARTSAAIEKLKHAGIPYIVVLTHPVYGGVTASLAMIGDIHLAEPKAMIGFAGKRVIEQTVREKLDEPFQRAEFLLEHGVIDQVVHRHALKDTIHRLLAKLLPLG